MVLIYMLSKKNRFYCSCFCTPTSANSEDEKQKQFYVTYRTDSFIERMSSVFTIP